MAYDIVGKVIGEAHCMLVYTSILHASNVGSRLRLETSFLL